MTIARDLANVASLMASSSANVVFDDSIVITNAANNSVVYLDGDKRATTNSNLYFNGSNFLSIVGSFAASAASGNTLVALGNVLDTAYITGYNYVGMPQLAFLTGDTEGMRLTRTGLGINKTSPNTALDVQGTVTATAFSGALRPRVVTIASASSITPNANTTDQYNVTALATNATITAPSGTPVDGQKLIIRIEDNGVARTLSWANTSGAYREIGATLPTITAANSSVVYYIGCIYNSLDTYWDVVAVTNN